MQILQYLRICYPVIEQLVRVCDNIEKLRFVQWYAAVFDEKSRCLRTIQISSLYYVFFRFAKKAIVIDVLEIARIHNMCIRK